MRLTGKIDFSEKKVSIIFSVFFVFLRNFRLSKTIFQLLRVTSDCFSPVGLLRVCSIIVQKTYGLFGIMGLCPKDKNPVFLSKIEFFVSSWGKVVFESNAYPSDFFSAL